MREGWIEALVMLAGLVVQRVPAARGRCAVKASTKSALVMLTACLVLVIGVSIAVQVLHWTTWPRVWWACRWVVVASLALRALGLTVPSHEGRGWHTSLMVKAACLRAPPLMLLAAATVHYGSVGVFGWVAALWVANLARETHEVLVSTGGRW